MQRRNLWPVAGAVLVSSVLMVLGGTAGGGELGRLVGGYGVLLLLAGLYLLVALAVRDRLWRLLASPRRQPNTAPSELHVRRIF